MIANASMSGKNAKGVWDLLDDTVTQKRIKSNKAVSAQGSKILDCAICLRSFQIKTGNQITCSLECRMQYRKETRARYKIEQKEARLKNIKRLGGKCHICNTTEKLEVHHRWYIDEDRATRSNHKIIENLITKQPKRFACLCRTCNTLVGHVSNSMKNGIYDKLILEAQKMAKGRTLHKNSIHTQRMRVPERQKRCAECSNLFNVSGKHGQKFCSDKCKKADRNRRQNQQYRQDHPQKTLICIVCSTSFKQSGNQLSCSQKCADKRTGELKKQYAHKHRVPKFGTCVICSTKFTRTDGTNTCSAKCRLHNNQLQARKNNKRVRQSYKQTHPPTFLKCVVCEDRFQKKPGPIASTCSEKCKGELRRQKYLQKHPPVFIDCTICGTPFKRHGPHKTCSAKCHQIHNVRYRHEYNSKLQRERDLGIQRNPYRECVMCKKEFLHVAGPRKTCSDECQSDLEAQRRRAK